MKHTSTQNQTISTLALHKTIRRNYYQTGASTHLYKHVSDFTAKIIVIKLTAIIIINFKSGSNSRLRQSTQDIKKTQNTEETQQYNVQ